MTEPSAPPAPAVPPARSRKRYKIAGPLAWAEIKALYLVGVPASELAGRFDVTEHAIRKRMTKEGWTRRAHASAVLDLALPAVGGDRRPAAETAEAMARAVGAAASARASADPDDGEGAEDGEADPLEAARTLLRRAAASAVAGRLARAGAAVKLAEGLARAAAALGLADDGAGDDDWDGEGGGCGGGDHGYRPRLTPEELEALRDKVEHRFARFDPLEEDEEPPAPSVAPCSGRAEAPGGGCTVEVGGGAWAAGAAVGDAPEAASGGEGRAVAAAWPPAWLLAGGGRPRGIGEPYRPLTTPHVEGWGAPPACCGPSLRGL